MKVKTCPFDLTCLLVLTHLSFTSVQYIYRYIYINEWVASFKSFFPTADCGRGSVLFFLF